MEQLNPGYKYKRNAVLVELDDKIGENWPLCYHFSTGNSGEDGKDHGVSISTNNMHGTDVPDELSDAKFTAELIARLLNFYFKGLLFVGDPRQIELFKTNLTEDDD